MSSVRLVISGPIQNYIHKSTGPSVRIGRSLKCEFNIPSENLSREHCLFEIKGEKYFITDLGSKNGVTVDGKKLHHLISAEVTESSDIILAGKYKLRINYFEVKTRTDILLNKLHAEADTKTFKLEVAEKKMPLKVKKSFSSSKRPNKKIQEIKGNSEIIKMILGFMIVLGFILYQLFGT